MEERKILHNLTRTYPALASVEAEIYRAFQMLVQCYQCRGKLLICGNGGSAADSDHIVGELMKGFLKDRALSVEEKEIFRQYGDDYKELAGHLQKALPAISLTGHPAFMTAYMNDVDPDMIFGQQVYAYGESEKDVLLAMSTSGNSANVVNAVKVAKVRGIGTIGFTGKSGGRLRELCDICICLPQDETFKVQELVLPVYHALCAMLEEKFFGNKKGADYGK